VNYTCIYQKILKVFFSATRSKITNYRHQFSDDGFFVPKILTLLMGYGITKYEKRK